MKGRTRFTLFCVALTSLAFTATPLRGAPNDALHPLDPLTAKEITVAADTLKALEAFPKDALFSTIVLHEPPKQEVLDFKPGSVFRLLRRATRRRRGRRRIRHTPRAGWR